MGFIRIEVVIIAVIRVDILIWVHSWVISLGRSIDTICLLVERVRHPSRLTVCAFRKMLTIYRIAEKLRRTSSKQSWQ